MKISIPKVRVACMLAVVAFNSAFAGNGVWIKREGVGSGGTDWANWNDEANWDQGVIATGADGYADLTGAAGQYVSLPDGDFAINRFWGAGDTVIRSNGKLVLGDLNGTFGKAWLYGDCTVQNSDIYRGPENLVLCGDVTSVSGKDILWWSPTFRLDLYANASGEKRIACPVPAEKSLYWNFGAMTVTAPHGSSETVVARWRQTGGSAFLSRAAGQGEHVLSVGTAVAGMGIPDGTFLKRVFPDGTIELSAAATETIAENELTFAAFTSDVSLQIPALLPFNGSAKRVLRFQKYREEDKITLKSAFYPCTATDDNRYLTVTTDEGMIPGKLILTGDENSVTYLTLDNADVELSGDMAKSEISVPATARRAILSVPEKASYAVGCLSSAENTLVKEGEGRLTVGVRKSALSYDASAVVIKEGVFAPSSQEDGEALFIRSLTVKSGAAIEVPATGLHVGSLVLEPGAILSGEGLLEYDAADETLFKDVKIACDGIRKFNGKAGGAFDVSLLSGSCLALKENGEKIMIFESGSATLKVDGSGMVDIFCVGGGGGGGTYAGGGGGGGGVVSTQSVKVVAGYYGISVGKGGKGSSEYERAGENGDDSTAFGVVARGGGGGGSRNNAAAQIGGSGGGAGATWYLNDKLIPGAAGTEGQGYAGGGSATSKNHLYYAFGGGGGGAGGSGQAAEYEARAGNGGEGVRCAIWNSDRVFGSGGGGGSGHSSANTAGKGGTGAGDGANWASSVAKPGTDGLDGWGGGGGGGGRFSESSKGNGGNGGCGIVIVRYRPAKKGTVITVR